MPSPRSLAWGHQGDVDEGPGGPAGVEYDPPHRHARNLDDLVPRGGVGRAVARLLTGELVVEQTIRHSRVEPVEPCGWRQGRAEESEPEGRVLGGVPAGA